MPLPDSFALRSSPDQEWIVDSGTSHHMTPSPTLIQDLSPHHGRVFIGDNTIPVHSIDTLNIIPNGKGSKHPSQVLYVPFLGFHLLSVHQLC